MNEDTIVFLNLLEKEDKAGCIQFALSQTTKPNFNLVDFYENVLRYSLNSMKCHNDSHAYCVWKEHIHTGIVRTIIECMYPYVIAHQKKHHSPKTVVVLCPDGEHHELGARIITDYFTLEGHNAYFVGGSTPKEDVYDAILTLKPDVVAISVTNRYNLVSTKNTIDYIRSHSQTPVTMIVGGRAFEANPLLAQDLGADHCLNSYEELVSLGGQV